VPVLLSLPSFSWHALFFLLVAHLAGPSADDRTRRPEPLLSRGIVIVEHKARSPRSLGSLSLSLSCRGFVIIMPIAGGGGEGGNCRLTGRREGIDRRDNDTRIEQCWRVVVDNGRRTITTMVFVVAVAGM
jgi:hypothetical protein